MTSVEAAIDIKVPVQHVFEVLTDPRRAPEWNPNVVEVTGFSGYPIRVGSTWQQVVMVLGRQTRLQCRVVEYRPPHEGVIDVSGDQRGRIWTRCAPVTGGTHVEQGMEFVPPGGALGRLGVSVMKGRIRQELYAAMVRQREALEAEGNGSRSGG